jgi:hypothetical protein
MESFMQTPHLESRHDAVTPRRPQQRHLLLGGVRGRSYDGMPLRCQLSRNERRHYRACAHRMFAAGRLSRLDRDVALAMEDLLGPTGILAPGKATVAHKARCCERTIQTALNTLRDLHMLRWVRRVVQVGWRRVQTSNCYELLTNGFVPPSTDGNRCRESIKGRKSRLWEVLGRFNEGCSGQAELDLRVNPAPMDALQAQEALMRIAEERQAKRDAEWRATRALKWRS